MTLSGNSLPAFISNRTRNTLEIDNNIWQAFEPQQVNSSEVDFQEIQF